MIDDQPLAKLGGPTYKQVTPKTYQVLEESLPANSGAGSFVIAIGEVDLYIVLYGFANNCMVNERLRGRWQ